MGILHTVLCLKGGSGGWGVERDMGYSKMTRGSRTICLLCDLGCPGVYRHKLVIGADCDHIYMWPPACVVSCTAATYGRKTGPNSISGCEVGGEVSHVWTGVQTVHVPR